MTALFPYGSRTDVKGHPSSRLLAASERGTATFILEEGTPSPKVLQCGAEVQYVVKKWDLFKTRSQGRKRNYKTIHVTAKWAVLILNDNTSPFGSPIDSFYYYFVVTEYDSRSSKELQFRDGLHTTNGGEPRFEGYHAASEGGPTPAQQLRVGRHLGVRHHTTQMQSIATAHELKAPLTHSTAPLNEPLTSVGQR
jgi:hypothetical protein